MANTSDFVSGACDCCLSARTNRFGSWYCSKRKNDYFPEAPWDGVDEYEPTSCPGFKPDRECYEPEDWVW